MFSVYNALAAVSCMAVLGFNLIEISGAIKQCGGVKGRAEVVPVPAEYTVIIDYAHSPDGVEKILKTVREVSQGRVIALTGCGGDRDHGKRPLMGKIACENSDICIITSDNPRTEDPKKIIDDILEGAKGLKNKPKVIVDRTKAIDYALSIAKKGDVIVLMGKGHETYQEINGIKHHMDEREIVADYFKKQEK